MAGSAKPKGAAKAAKSLPAALEATVHEGLNLLEKRLRCNVQNANTHRTVVIEGWADDSAAIDAVAAYLVGLLACTISRALGIRAQIEHSKRDKLELQKSVEDIIGSATKPLNSDQKTHERNPWIAEGLWHLCLFLATRRPEFHLSGAVIALDFPHIGAKDHGFDVVALYRDGATFGISFVECKAYEINPNGAINDAVTFYKKIDRGEYDPGARQVVASLRTALPTTDQGAVSMSLWKDERTYLPNPHYDSSVSMDWTNSRPSFAGLAVASRRITVMPHAIGTFTAFFDAVANSMARLAKKLKNV